MGVSPASKILRIPGKGTQLETYGDLQFVVNELELVAMKFAFALKCDIFDVKLGNFDGLNF
jgi:hypothetical protein